MKLDLFSLKAIILYIFMGVIVLTYIYYNDINIPKIEYEKWETLTAQDKMTDEITVKSYAKYSIGGGEMAVIADCIYNKTDDIGSHVDFEFTMFTNDDNKPKVFDDSISYLNYSAVLSKSIFSSLNTVEFEYRLDNKKLRTWYSKSKYNNVVKVKFYEKAALPADEDFIANSESLEDLLISKILRIRLPVKGGNPADIEIQLSDLHEFFITCPATKSKIIKDTSHNDNSGGKKNPYTENNITNGNYSKNKTDGDLDSVLKTVKEMGQKDTVPKATSNDNCNNSQKSTLDILVCSDEELSTLDSNLNIAYQNTLRNVGEQGKASMKADQIKWRRSRSQTCNLQQIAEIDENESSRLIRCLRETYKQRLSELHASKQKTTNSYRNSPNFDPNYDPFHPERYKSDEKGEPPAASGYINEKDWEKPRQRNY